MTLTRLKITVFATTIIIIVLLIGGLLVSMIAKNRAYSLLEDAVASQSFADSLDYAKHISRECYPTDGGQDYCPTLFYELTNDDCKQIKVAFKELNCDGYSDTVKTFKGTPITYRVAASEEKRTLEVYVNKASNLY